MKRNENDTPVIGCYCLCNTGGIEILDIRYGIEDKVLFRWRIYDTVSRKTLSVVRTDDFGRSYFNTRNTRIYLDECIKVNYDKI